MGVVYKLMSGVFLYSSNSESFIPNFSITTQIDLLPPVQG
ncbi:hypothetical protein yfred0001_14430 [Yersinia frederiksenii ATCC 33641]|nr:hypothetical protein yfred0001_14430 [Yersinia frederiksenii ATCC 33641]